MTRSNDPKPRSLNTDPLVLSLVRWLLILIFVVIGWWLVSALATILAPILVALGIAYLLDPILERMVARGMSRALGATILLFLFLGVIALGVALAIPAAVSQITSFIKSAPTMLDDADKWISCHFDFRLKDHLTTEELTGLLGDAKLPFEKILSTALGGILSVLAVLGEFLLIPVFAYYFLLDWPHMTERLIKLVPPRRRSRVKDILAEVDGVVSGWVRGQAIVTSTLAVLYAIAFSIIGVPLAIPLGLIVGALTIIPFVGTFVGAAITAVVLLLDWPGGTVVGAVAGTFVVLHLLEAAVLTPKITGHKVGLSESAALLAVVAGGKVLGFVGILLAVPLAATVGVLLRHLMRYYESTEFFGEESDAIVPVTPAMSVVMMASGDDSTPTKTSDDETAGG